MLTPLTAAEREHFLSLLNHAPNTPDPRYAIFNRIDGRAPEHSTALSNAEKKSILMRLAQAGGTARKKRPLRGLIFAMVLAFIVVFSFALVNGGADALFDQTEKNAFQQPHDSARTLPDYPTALATTYDFDGISIRPIAFETAGKRLWMTYEVQLPPQEHFYGSGEDDFPQSPNLLLAGSALARPAFHFEEKTLDAEKNIRRITLARDLPAPLPQTGAIDVEQKITQITTYRADTEKVTTHKGDLTIAFTADAGALALETLTVAKEKIPAPSLQSRSRISASSFNRYEGRIEVKTTGFFDNGPMLFLKGEDDAGHEIVFTQGNSTKNSFFFVNHGTAHYYYQNPVAPPSKQLASSMPLDAFITPGRKFTLRLYRGDLEGRQLIPIDEPFNLTLEKEN